MAQSDDRLSASFDLNVRPWIAIWEVTRACDLACRHCRADAQPWRHPDELTTAEGVDLLQQVARLRVPVFVFTGGDCLKRPDFLELVAEAARLKLRPAVTPSATPLLTSWTIRQLRQAGAARMALSLDGASAEVHDDFRRVPGSYERTLMAARAARQEGLELQINTTVGRHNRDELGKIAEQVKQLGAILWSVFFLIPTGRGLRQDCLDADETEAVFHQLYALGLRLRLPVKTTEAMHFRRFLLQQRAERRKDGLPVLDLQNTPRGINDGAGFVFISHTGDVCPSGFLPLSAGNLRTRGLAELYCDSPLFQTLRDRAQLKGKCEVCEFRHVCGGSRARAYAMTGDWLASDPACAYVPAAAKLSSESAPSLEPTEIPERTRVRDAPKMPGPDAQ